MKKALFLFAAMCAARCFGIAASQAWVANYVSNYVNGAAASVQASTTVERRDGNMVVTANAGTPDEMRLVVQESTDAAMLATNCTGAAMAQGVSNGCTFVWNGAGAYINPQGTILCTATNMVFRDVVNVSTNGMERFAGWFDAMGVLIQPHTSHSITNGIAEVTQ